jgi:hypothetical protein
LPRIMASRGKTDNLPRSRENRTVPGGATAHGVPLSAGIFPRFPARERPPGLNVRSAARPPLACQARSVARVTHPRPTEAKWTPFGYAVARRARAEGRRRACLGRTSRSSSGTTRTGRAARPCRPDACGELCRPGAFWPPPGAPSGSTIRRSLAATPGMGRAGFEPATLGLKVRPELLRQAALG